MGKNKAVVESVVHPKEIVRLFFEGYTIKKLVKLVASESGITQVAAQAEVEGAIYDYYMDVKRKGEQL